MSHCPFAGGPCPLTCGLPISGAVGALVHVQRHGLYAAIRPDPERTTSVLHRVPHCITSQPPANDARYADQPHA